MSAIYLVRHGQASFDGANYDQLSPLGHQQAQVLGQALAARGLAPQQVICGAMRRHAETAENCLAAMGRKAEWRVDAGWSEYNHLEILSKIDARLGSQGGVSAYAREHHTDPRRAFEVLFTQAMARWMGGAHDADYGEPWPRFVARVQGSLAALAALLERGGTALVFTSGGPISVAVGRLLALSDERIFQLNWSIANGSVTKLVVSTGAARLSTLNEHGHFEHAAEHLLTYR